ncbi:hypothetical protein Aph02nite_69020 [Actinoplanes philippinensis]|uniref:Uncharacterized protein n=1 Tax=Actinoplanes philippinensis TaxID=35752 RepID=A0A1I2KN30_9ACTN|nr:hypothetical protein [Actinoplanes philippinensis]GIE80952.1 hypothetical protein Aph02nite_69020 [Actinoplanes philippinensis]SFF67650.1 hypothetical protein SAMN05421541_117135 [Actinoplanes philippinensis]
MTDCEAGRVERTARRSAVVPHGGSPLMPSHSQGAERRPERRAGRTGSRLLLRALVVGGLAGVAWLLTGSAAQAADPGAGPSGAALGSLSDEVATAAGCEPAVGELLEAAVQPPEVAPEHHRRPILTTSLVTLDETAGALPRTASSSPRTSGGTVDDRTLPVPPEAVPDPESADATADRPARTAQASSTPRPDDDGLAPWRAPGAVTGAPALVPGAFPKGGSTAVLPARVAKGAVGCHRLPVAADVEARRNDAVAPTVSPD